MDAKFFGKWIWHYFLETSTLRRLRPFRRRLFKTFFPPVVLMRARKPCLRFALILLGWKVLFMTGFLAGFWKNQKLKVWGWKHFYHCKSTPKKTWSRPASYIFSKKSSCQNARREFRNRASTLLKIFNLSDGIVTRYHSSRLKKEWLAFWSLENFSWGGFRRIPLKKLLSFCHPRFLRRTTDFLKDGEKNSTKWYKVFLLHFFLREFPPFRKPSLKKALPP